MITKRQLAEELHEGTEANYVHYRGSVGGREGSIRDTVRLNTKAELVARVEARRAAKAV